MKVKENYANLKTQCVYRFCNEIVNEWKLSIDSNNIYIDWIKNNEIMIWKEIFDVRKLIKEDLRSFRRMNHDKDWKKQIEDKEQQKSRLKWRSPDFWDCLIMRYWFQLKPKLNFFTVAI